MWFKKKQSVVHAVHKHRPTSKHQRILNELKGGQKSNLELSRVSLRFGGFIHELRKEGFNIVTQRVDSDGLYIYTLKGKVR